MLFRSPHLLLHSSAPLITKEHTVEYFAQFCTDFIYESKKKTCATQNHNAVPTRILCLQLLTPHRSGKMLEYGKFYHSVFQINVLRLELEYLIL